jgi:hypothetical protein
MPRSGPQPRSFTKTPVFNRRRWSSIQQATTLRTFFFFQAIGSASIRHAPASLELYRLRSCGARFERLPSLRN